MTATFLPDGAPAPRFTLKSIGSQRTFSLAALRGRTVILLFVDRHTAQAARNLVERVRRRYPNHEQVTVALVLDLNNVPKFLRGTAERFIESAYAEGAGQIPPEYDPADHLILLPDWTGQLFGGYHIADASHEIAAVVINPSGQVVTTIQAPDTANQVMDTLTKLE